MGLWGWGGRSRLTATPCTRPWAAASSGATARRSLRPCSSTSPTPPVWPCACTTSPPYFEAEREDDLRRVGYSKERRVDPQIIVGLLVDRRGFPLQVGCWEGNKAETTTIIPVVEAFQAAHGIEDLIIVADASMLSAANLTTLDDARLRFIVGARTTRAPGDLEAHFHWAGDAFTDGQVIDTITPKRGSKSERDKSRKAEPVWDPDTHPGSWRAVWAYSKRRAARDNQTLTAQANRARAIRRRREAPQGHAFRHRPSRRSGPR